MIATSTSDTKLRLSRYKRKMNELDRINDRLTRLANRIHGIKSPPNGEVIHGGTSPTMVELLCDKQYYQKKYETLEGYVNQLRQQTVDEIHQLDDVVEQGILLDHFVYMKDITVIAKDNGFSERHVYRLYHQGINKLTKIYNGKCQ